MIVLYFDSFASLFEMLLRFAGPVMLQSFLAQLVFIGA